MGEGAVARYIALLHPGPGRTSDIAAIGAHVARFRVQQAAGLLERAGRVADGSGGGSSFARKVGSGRCPARNAIAGGLGWRYGPVGLLDAEIPVAGDHFFRRIQHDRLGSGLN